MERKNLLYSTVKIVCKFLASVLFPYKVMGKDNVNDLKGSYILCSNHLSNIDSVYLVISHKRKIRFMAKSQLFRNKFLSFFFLGVGAFPVDRGSGDKKAISESQNILRNGEILGMFIEGTRSKTGDFLRPKSGAALLAIKEKVPIVPVCVTGGGKQNKVKLFKRSYISYGKPLYLHKSFINEDASITEIRESSKLIMDKIRKIRSSEHMVFCSSSKS